MELIFCFDLFAQRPNLLINSKSQMHTILGLIISFITYIIFILILLYELQEVIYKQNPYIITNKFDSMIYNSSLTFNKEYFKLILVPDNPELLEYFKLNGTFQFNYKENGILKNLQKKLIYSKCEAQDLDEDYKAYFNEYNINIETAVCIGNLYSDSYENITNFDLELDIVFRECNTAFDTGCKANPALYEQIKIGTLSVSYQTLYKSHILNVFDNDKPFISHIKTSSLMLLSLQNKEKLHTILTLMNYGLMKTILLIKIQIK
jgi:hypothetical protein